MGGDDRVEGLREFGRRERLLCRGLRKCGHPVRDAPDDAGRGVQLLLGRFAEVGDAELDVDVLAGVANVTLYAQRLLAASGQDLQLAQHL